MIKRLGIVGCGQLGQMLGRAAQKLGAEVSFLKVNENPVVEGIGRVFEEYEVESFLSNVDFVTIEREAIPDRLLEQISGRVSMSPSFDSLMSLRLRHKQKSLFDCLNIPTAPWIYVENKNELEQVIEDLSFERIRAKRILGGYDGGGQWTIDKKALIPSIPEDAFPLILEAEVTVDYEISVLSARGQNGEFIHYPINHNIMRNGVLTWSFVPAEISQTMADNARQYAAKMMQSLNYVGVLAMEFFVSNGQLIVNEIAPRVHNTGHWTIEGCNCDQFEQHVRAVMGLPLLEPQAVSAAGMCNLLGDSFPTVLPKEPVRMYLHGYGKSLRPNRKMGHLTITGPNLEMLHQVARDIGFMGDSNLV